MPRRQLRMLDLFSGLGGASAAMRERGWDVVTVDAEPAFGCTHTADLTTWSYSGPPVDLVWASPPCTEFSRTGMPWCNRPAWVSCNCCDECWCNRHKQHVFECPCPAVEEWTRSPYLPAPDPSLDLACAAVRIIREVDPFWWVIENVRGAVRWLTPLLGREATQVGQAFLWGDFPHLGRVRVKAHKERLSSTRRAERSAIPYPISLALARACESSFYALEEANQHGN